MTERSLLIIKPDAVKKNLIGEILKRVENNQLRILALKKIQLCRLEAEAFYAVHQGKPFFDPLMDFMCSGPCVPVVLEGKNAIRNLRALIGNTDPEKAEPGTIRNDYAENLRVNAVHGSDAPETANKEIGFFFSEKELVES